MAKMTKAQAHSELTALGCNDADLKAVGGMKSVDWAKLIALVTAYGPQLLQILIALLGSNPLPSPLPTLTPKP